MKKKLFTMLLSFTMIAALTACGTETASAPDGGSAVAETEPAEADEPLEDAALNAAVTRAEWSLDDIATLSGIVTGVTDREYAVGEGADYKIYEDIAYDRGIVYTVLFNTAAVRFDEPGEYPMTYWVYFDAAALSAYAKELNTGLLIPDTGRLAVWVYATVTVTEPEEDEGDEDAEDTEDIEAVIGAPDGGAAASSVSSGSSGGSSKSASSGSRSSGSTGGSSSGSSKSGNSATACNHNWVEITKEEDVYELVCHTICNTCGEDISGNAGEHAKAHALNHENDGYHSEYWSEKVGTKTVGTGTYKCSKCGATK